MIHPDIFNQQIQTTPAMGFRTEPQAETPLIHKFMLRLTR